MQQSLTTADKGLRALQTTRTSPKKALHMKERGNSCISIMDPKLATARTAYLPKTKNVKFPTNNTYSARPPSRCYPRAVPTGLFIDQFNGDHFETKTLSRFPSYQPQPQTWNFHGYSDRICKDESKYCSTNQPSETDYATFVSDDEQYNHLPPLRPSFQLISTLSPEFMGNSLSSQEICPVERGEDVSYDCGNWGEQLMEAVEEQILANRHCN
ncbi:hypothetical protein NEOLI_003182 [Neolecta irregularis DAH-3]|uniref:Uncharacterized protein n=1 Tax=Neolecta irregularis (strain DAH-3) TaxID=1198029 RepID=A0A1U7LPZ2_NEOID|nr:hypothetical protein NEOLI_003182 [Neolecta irregularis DAH-3]|eukprot:OLL24699.1 hypothetical protein NEOLI_003182 [Neolecta irregularis DAH-3]